MYSETKIGILIPQSRQYKTLDRDFIRGIKLNNLNARFFVESIGIGADEQLIIEKIQKLNHQEGVTVIIGFFGHYNMEHVYEYAADNDIILIAADLGATMPYSQTKYKGVYINSFALAESGYLLGDYFVKNNYKKITSATSYYDAGYGMLSAIEAAFSNDTAFSGHYVTPFEPRENEATYMQEAIDAYKPDVVFAFYSGLYANENSDFISQNKITRKYPFYVTAFSITEKILEEYKNDPYDLFVVSSWLNDNADSDFNGKYKETYQDNASVFSLLGYENGLVVNDILTAAGNNRAIPALIHAMGQLNSMGPRGPIRFDPDTNRTLFNHYIYKLNLEDSSTIGFKKINTLHNTGHYIKAVTTRDVPSKIGGWQNAYLCH